MLHLFLLLDAREQLISTCYIKSPLGFCLHFLTIRAAFVHLAASASEEMSSKAPPRSWASIPAPPGEGQLRVMSYNILADEYTLENFSYCPKEFLDWGHRLKHILLEIMKKDCEIVCLQEVSSRAYVKQLMPLLSKRGYKGTYLRKSGREELEGVAVFYKTDKLALVETHRLAICELSRDLELSSKFGRVAQSSSSPPASPAAQASPSAAPAEERADMRGHDALWRRLDTMPHVALAAVFVPIGGSGHSAGGSAAAQPQEDDDDMDGSRSGPGAMPTPSSPSPSNDASQRLPTLAAQAGGIVPAGQPIVITNFHAYWNPKWPEVKVLQVGLVIAAANRIRRSINARAGRDDAAVIFCGDLNTMPLLKGPTESDPLPGEGGRPLVPGVYELLVSGRLDSSHPHHPVARRSGLYYKSDLPPLSPASMPALQLPLRFASAYVSVSGSEPEWSNWHTHDFCETLDYIFVATHEAAAVTEESASRSSSSGDDYALEWRPLRAVPQPFSVLQPPSKTDVMALQGAAGGGCPNEGVPSDHIPLAAKFALQR